MAIDLQTARPRPRSHGRYVTVDPDIRFRASFVVAENGCWTWTRQTSDGYGVFYPGRKAMKAHRWAYERYVDAIPEGLTIDHLCRNRACVNPLHMEPVTRLENIRRGENRNHRAAQEGRCVAGHARTTENTYVYASGKRHCRVCARERYHRSRYGY